MINFIWNTRIKRALSEEFEIQELIFDNANSNILNEVKDFKGEWG